MGRAHGAHRHDARVRRDALGKRRDLCPSTPARAFFAGLGVTGLLQSSTATALLLASFTARGLITLSIALVMMLGANVGTTLVAQVFAFDVTWLWAIRVGSACSASSLREADKVARSRASLSVSA